MKKYFWLLLTLILLLWTSVFATYEDFSDQLKTMGLDTQKIESQDTISRYELSRLLNVVECKDCINPSQNIVNRYTPSYWNTFVVTPGKDFADISYIWGIYDNKSYYYCVAYVGENSYMNWYPKATSPVCGGKFCGEKNTTTAEFIQVIINIIAKYIYKDTSVNWKEVNTRGNNLRANSYEEKNLTIEDKKIITEKSESCTNTCALQNTNEMNIYLTYCMFNLNACGMQEIGKIKQWYWPVAELNLLYKQDIIDIDQNQRKNTDKNIDGKTVLETLFKINGKIDCSFNNDYDCDGLDNANDSCPNAYNPKQKDTDKDKIGDVCDDDIDGDGVKNPIGIVDDEEKINIALRTQWIDNCLFIQNTDQKDENNNKIGDLCENVWEYLGIYISLDTLEGTAPLTTTFKAVTSGNIQKILRDFWDGFEQEWNPLQHTFTTPGTYNVQATAQWTTTKAKAQITVVVWWESMIDKWLQSRASSIGGEINNETTLSLSTLGTFDEIQWNFQKENIITKKNPDETITKIFTIPWEHPIIVKWYENGNLKAVNAFTVGIGTGRWSILRSNTLSPELGEKILLDTKTYNINQNDIVNVYRDFGDNTKKNTTTMTIEYKYTKAGTKAISQILTFNDGKKQTNMLTLQVKDKSLLSSYALLMSPSKLITSVGEKIFISTRIIGTLFKTPILQTLEQWDTNSQQKPGTEKMPTLFSYSYKKSWLLTPQSNLYIDQCTYLKNQATIAVKWTDLCLDASIEGTLTTKYKCDLDGDKIPDICDTDIDGDGIQNLLGIINNENEDCSYSTNKNQVTETKHYQSICSLDNAPFVSNVDQLDLNLDWIGDIQTETTTNITNEFIDSDRDGIPDTKDICPTIQETRNGIQDTDWCPEIGNEIVCNPIIPDIWITNENIIVKPTECNQCPCQFWDFANDLNNNDQVRAVLRDKEKTIQYRLSSPWIVTF